MALEVYGAVIEEADDEVVALMKRGTSASAATLMRNISTLQINVSNGIAMSPAQVARGARRLGLVIHRLQHQPLVLLAGDS